jgi:hypothetical protein
VSTEQFRACKWRRNLTHAYIKRQRLTLEGTERRQAAAIPCQAYTPSQEAKASVMDPFTSESNTEENAAAQEGAFLPSSILHGE